MEIIDISPSAIALIKKRMSIIGRRWIGIEISGAYCSIAEKRILQERNQLKLNI